MMIPMIMMIANLGRTIDLRTAADTRINVFDKDVIQQNLMTIKRPFTQSSYLMVESSSDVTDFLKVNGELTLKMKKGDFDFQGYGSYLQNSVDRENTVEILISVYHETVTETFPSYLPLKPGWENKEIGSHYIRSITYGGHLLISYKVKAIKSEYMEDIKAGIKASLQPSGSFDANATGDFKKMEQSIAGKSQIDIVAYATTKGSSGVPTNLEAVMKLVDEYPARVAEINDGKGAYLRLEVLPLHLLDPKRPQTVSTQAVRSITDDAINKYDDIRAALTELDAFLSQLERRLTPEENKAVQSFMKRVKKAKRAIVSAISSLDISKSMNPDHFDAAFLAYGEGDRNVPNRFTRELEKLKHQITKVPFFWYPYTKAVTNYIHWGNSNCTLPSPEPVLIGYAATSPSGFGNGADILCLPIEPVIKDWKQPQTVSEITGITYQTPEKKTGPLYCAYCRLENATAVASFSSRTSCPDSMKLEYSGFVAVNTEANSKMLCIDSHPGSKSPGSEPTKDSSAGVFRPVLAKCEECGKDDEDEFPMKPLPCVVCSR